MLSLALTVALSSASGGLLTETDTTLRHARLIESPVSFAGSMALGARPIEAMSLPELEQARQEELDNRRSLVAPIVLIVVGGAAVITANILWAVWPATTAASALVGIGIGAAIFIAGIVVAAVGVGILISAIVRNAKSAKHLNRIENRIDELRASPQYAPQPQPGDAPPPPPPPMPTGAFLDLTPGSSQLTLATF